VRVIILVFLSGLMFHKWNHQNKKYYGDFPFLMALTFALFAFSKAFDIFLYIFLSGGAPIEDFSQLSSNMGVFLLKLSFIFSPVLVIIPYIIILLEIWLEDRRKLQIGLLSSFIVIFLLGIFLSQSYTHLLIVSVSVSLLPLLMSSVSFFIIHVKKRMPGINSLLIAIGQMLYLISQIIRPLWYQLGSDPVWGLTWVAEIVESIPFIINAIGYLIPAFYTIRESPMVKVGPPQNYSTI